MPGRPLLSVIMPVYNERSTLREIVRRVQAVPMEKEIVAVDDGSTDGSESILEQLAAEQPNFTALHQPRNQGKGAAIRRALEHCRGEVILIQDADLEYNPAEYPLPLQPILDGKADVVSNMFANLNLPDMETCYKVFRAEVLKRVRLTSNRFGFDPEVTAQAVAALWTILRCALTPLPVRLYNLLLPRSGWSAGSGRLSDLA